MTTLTPFYNQYRSTADRPQENIPHLTLLHGWGVHSLVWDQLMPTLLEHFRVTIVDLPGMGNSPIPNGDYTLELLCQQVASVMPDKTHLLGWSLGGLVALKLAQQLPQRVLSVATVATSPCFVQRDDWPTAAADTLFSKFEELLREDNNGTLIRFMALVCNGSRQQAADLAMMKEILHFCGLPAPRALRDGLAIFRHTDLRDLLATLPQPLLMLFADEDAIIPATTANAVAALAPTLEVDLLSHSSHVPLLSEYQQVAQRLEVFWQHRAVV